LDSFHFWALFYVDAFSNNSLALLRKESYENGVRLLGDYDSMPPSKIEGDSGNLALSTRNDLGIFFIKNNAFITGCPQFF